MSTLVGVAVGSIMAASISTTGVICTTPVTLCDNSSLTGTVSAYFKPCILRKTITTAIAARVAIVGPILTGASEETANTGISIVPTSALTVAAASCW